MVKLANYDLILVNSSAGKDSLVMLDVVAKLAREAGCLERVVVVHCDLGRVEWPGTVDLVHKQAAVYGLPVEVEKRPQGDLLDHVRERGMWPSSTARYCTSDHKRGQSAKVVTRLVNAKYNGTPLRVLECLGFRADESPARAKRHAFTRNRRLSNGKRLVDTWLPIHDWSEGQVWDRIRGQDLPYHPAYDLGMPRLSCCFCIFAPREALILAGRHNRELLNEYVQVEAAIDHEFRQGCSLASIATAVDAGEGSESETVSSWRM